MPILPAIIARQLEEIGLTVQVEVVQKSLLLELTSTSRALFFRGSWIADYPDAENYLSVFYSKNPAPPNYTRYQTLSLINYLKKRSVKQMIPSDINCTDKQIRW